MEKTEEKSQEQADIITSIISSVIFLDIAYCREIAQDMLSQASKQEAIAVLNPSYPQLKNDILRAQAKALITLCDYVQSLKEIEVMKSKLSQQEAIQEGINKLFLT